MSANFSNSIINLGVNIGHSNRIIDFPVFCVQWIYSNRIKMQTRAQASGALSLPPKIPDPVVKPNARRLRELVHHSILNMEDRIVALEEKDVLTD